MGDSEVLVKIKKYLKKIDIEVRAFLVVFSIISTLIFCLTAAGVVASMAIALVLMVLSVVGKFLLFAMILGS